MTWTMRALRPPESILPRRGAGFGVVRSIALGIVATVALIACTEDERLASPQLPQVSVVEARAEMVPQNLSVFGTVTHRSKADVYPRTEGRIIELYAEEGDQVASGAPLAQLETVQLEISLEQARADVAGKRSLLGLALEKLSEGRRRVEAQLLAIERIEQEVAQKHLEAQSIRETLDNRERLLHVGGVAEGELDALRTQYHGARTRLLQAQKDLEIAQIGYRDVDLLQAGIELPSDDARRTELLVELNVRRLAAEADVAESELEAALAELFRIEVLRDESLICSPIAGVVGRRYLDLGEKASPKTVLYTVLDTSSVFTEVHVSEDELPRIRQGQGAELLMDRSSEELPLYGRVHLITPFVDPQSRSTRVRILLQNPRGTLVPGMFLRGRIEVGPPKRELTLPLEAVAFDGPQGNEVLLLRGDSVFRRAVETGRISDGRIVVLGGVEEGDLVVSNASRSIPEGTRVEVAQ